MSGSSQNLTLVLPVPADPAVANVWGAILNNNDNLLDSYTGGTLNLSVAGNTNVVLTSTSGVANQSLNANFNFTGVLTGNITVFWPVGRGRMFSVTNSTTGGFTLSIAAGTSVPLGSTVTVPQGGALSLASDGTNVTPRVNANGIGAITDVGTISFEITSQAFTSNGTYTPTPGMTYAVIECWGPGGGAGGTASSQNGAAGTATSLGSLVIANSGGGGGGNGGAPFGPGGTGGTGGTGIPGSPSADYLGGGSFGFGLNPLPGAAANFYGQGGSAVGDTQGTGGGGGEYRRAAVSASSVGASQPVTIGVGGLGYSGNGLNGFQGYVLITEYLVSIIP